MVIMIKEKIGGKVQVWTGNKWSDRKVEAKQYCVQDDNFTFGIPFPTAKKGEKLGFWQMDGRRKWRMMGIPSPEETLATVHYSNEMHERMCPNVVLVLMKEGEVRSVVMVKRKAIEQNPELLKRLKDKAATLYDQFVVMEERPALLEPDELCGWLERVNSEDKVPWEEEAKWAVSGALDTLYWNLQTGKVELEMIGPSGKSTAICGNMRVLVNELTRIGQAAWSNKVPSDGSGEVFNFTEKAVPVEYMLLDRCGDRLKEMGWI